MRGGRKMRRLGGAEPSSGGGRRWACPGRRTVAGAALLLVLTWAPAQAAAATSRAPGYGPVAAAAGADHDCITPGGPAPTITWADLRNPVLSYPNAGAKDQAIVWAFGRWHMLFSYMTHDRSAPGGTRWNVATATSADLVHWSAASPWPRQPGYPTVASPDVVRSPSGRFVATFQATPAHHGQAKLFYRTSTDLVHWSAPRPLGHSLHPASGQRMIDGALAYTGHGLLLGYKSGTENGHQAFEVAWSANNSLAGPWKRIGQPAITVVGATIENYEFLTVAGHWMLVATSTNLDEPWMFRLTGNPSRPSGWLHWSSGSQLTIPGQPWDTGTGISSIGYEHANSAFLCNATSVDGAYYLLYAGSSELTAFGGWGHAKIGIAQSTDLVQWTVPPPAS